MVEILFGDNEAGAMKIARRRTSALGCDVVCLPLMLDIGDISQPALSKYRRSLLCSMLYREQWGADEEMKNELKGLGGVYAKELDRLRGLMKSGESLRVWYSAAPYSMCGLMWLCGRLAHYEGEVYAVELPRRTVGESVVVERSSWGEVEEFAELLPLRRRLTALEARSLAAEWDMLVKENAPLRAVVNGAVIGVPTGFYDFLIWKNLGDEPMTQATLIGRILCKNQLGVGDWWYAARIERFIRLGRIKVVENSDKKYARKICLNNDR